MGDPHRKDRYGEVWPQRRIDAYLGELYLIAPDVVLSGGWAWHFLSPAGHPEFRHAHDHKDVDLFVPPERVASVCMDLEEMGFVKVHTRFDAKPSKEEFRRYEKVVEERGPDPFRITIDFFVRAVPFRQIGDYRVIEPVELLKLYGKIHSSENCWAVTAARKLLAQGLDPQGRAELIQPPAT